jgi:hypothetical protein
MSDDDNNAGPVEDLGDIESSDVRVNFIPDLDELLALHGLTESEGE